jgi:putative serine protease PepD
MDPNQTHPFSSSNYMSSQGPIGGTPPRTDPPQRRGLRILSIVLGVALLLGTGLVAGLALGRSNDRADNLASPATTTSIAPAVATTPTTTAPTESRTETSLNAAAVAAKVVPSVVTIHVGSGGSPIASGSGIIYDSGGDIVTNNHVVEAGNEYQAILSDGSEYPADLVGTDPITDLAVLHISASNLHPITIGSSDALTVGDPAIAVGSPLGLNGGPSLTVGVISAFGREVDTDPTTQLVGMLQTDAPITQGSSGGALVDANGRLIGITTAVGVSSVGIEGVGFATPVEILTRVADEIITNGSASAAYLGIYGSTHYVDTSDGGSMPVGVQIESVDPNTAAQAAGLQAGDVVSELNGTKIATMEQLVAQLRRYAANQTITLSVSSGGSGTVKPVEITLGQRPNT